MEVMRFTVIHLASTYILKHIVKIPRKLMNQRLILHSVTHFFGRIVYF